MPREANPYQSPQSFAEHATAADIVAPRPEALVSRGRWIFLLASLLFVLCELAWPLSVGMTPEPFRIAIIVGLLLLLWHGDNGPVTVVGVGFGLVALGVVTVLARGSSWDVPPQFYARHVAIVSMGATVLLTIISGRSLDAFFCYRQEQRRQKNTQEIDEPGVGGI